MFVLLWRESPLLCTGARRNPCSNGSRLNTSELRFLPWGLDGLGQISLRTVRKKQKQERFVSSLMATSLIRLRRVCELAGAGVYVFFYLRLAENRNWEDWSHGSRSALLEAAPSLSLLLFLLSKAHQPRSSPLATEGTNVARCTGSTTARIYCTLLTGTFISGSM